MATVTPNFNWPVPTSTDLVKDGATAIEALGDSIDASLVDLKGGTTGQVLSKNSNTDMDFVWSAAGSTSPLTTKGDLYGYSTTNARVPVGTNGQVLTADSTASTGVAWTTPSSGGSNTFYAGKNKIINGDFNVNQRSFTSTTTSGIFGFDRFTAIFAGGTNTYSAQAFTPGTAPVAGYEGKNFARVVSSGQSSSTDYTIFTYKVEDVRTLAGQTATLSFWAKAGSGTPSISVQVQQAFGTGGSSTVSVFPTTRKTAITTSWVRYSFNLTMPSLSGKTIGDNSLLNIYVWTSAGSSYNSDTNTLGLQAATIDFWGVQLEAGSTATDFVTASGGSLQGELAMCQRYYQRVIGNTSNTAYIIFGIAASSSRVFMSYAAPVAFRATPSVAQSSVSIGNTVISNQAITTISNYSNGGLTQISLDINVSSGLTAGSPYFMAMALNQFVEFSAEL